MWSVLSLCRPLPGAFGPFWPIRVGQPTFSRALGTLVHAGLGTLLSSPRPKPPSLGTQNAGGQPGVTRAGAVEPSRGRTWGKQVTLQVASNPDGKY